MYTHREFKAYKVSRIIHHLAAAARARRVGKRAQAAWHLYLAGVTRRAIGRNES